jgi:branched-chain amino acid aminotransferase
MLDSRTMPSPIWLDGALVSWNEARTSVLSHAIQRGALVFDVGALRPRGDGHPLLFRPREHIARFLQSAALLGLDVRYDAESLLAATLQTARECGVPSALVRWSAFVSSPEPDVVVRPGIRASVAIACITTEDYAHTAPVPRKPATIRVAVPREIRKAGPEVISPQAKAAGAYLGSMLAKQRAIAEGFDEVVLLDGEGRVAEAPAASVFAAHNGVLSTPPLERVLAGITRDCVLAIARAEGISARERHLSPEELAAGDEAFLASTSLPIQPIASVDGRSLGAGAPGPLTARIERVMLACERGADPRFAGWVVPV